MALCCVTPVFSLGLSAHSAILMDGDTGQVLYEKNPDETGLIASTTKIMTALVALEQGDLQTVVTIPQEAVGVEGSSMYLKAGEQRTLEELLYGLMLSSGNDAAVALAIAVSGNVTDFVGLMNEKAQELGLSHTHFANPNGLDSQENYSTARELGILAGEAMKNPEFRQIVSTKSYQCEGHDLRNHNKLLWKYPGALGVKTGFTKKAGRILVGAAEQKGRTLVSVTLNAPDDWSDHKAMLDYGFSLYQEQVFLSEEKSLGCLPVISGAENSVELISGESISGWSLPEEEIEIALNVPPFLYAPVEAGTEIGTAEVFLAGRSLGKVSVLTARQIPQAVEEPGIFERIKDYLAGFWPGSSPASGLMGGEMLCRNGCKRFWHPAELHHAARRRR